MPQYTVLYWTNEDDANHEEGVQYDKAEETDQAFDTPEAAREHAQGMDVAWWEVWQYDPESDIEVFVEQMFTS